MAVAAAFRSIGITKDHGDLDLAALEGNLRGRTSGPPAFRRALGRTRAGPVIEVGTRKSASVAQMRRVSRWLGPTIGHGLEDAPRPGGVLPGDDHDQAWPGAAAAVNRFAAAQGCVLHTAWPNHGMVTAG